MVIMKAGSFLVLCWLSLLLGFSHAADPQCTYYQDLAPKNIYYIYNPDYPNLYRQQLSCLWTMKSEYGVNISCNILLPRSIDCVLDRIEIQINKTVTHRYCGNGTINLLSDGRDMSVSLTTYFGTSGGKFLCEVKAVERKYETENCECGRKNPTRIVGGTDTGVNEYPMMCALVDLITRKPFCGCTIIHNKYVLSASHCVLNKEKSNMVILVGDHDYTNATDTDAARIHRVSEIIMHPDYDPKERLNDISVLTVTDAIEFNQKVGAACLPFQHSPDTFGGDFVQLLGWGFTDVAEAPSTTLQKVTVSVQTNLACQKNYPGVSVNELCTFTPDKDSCSMDSGGPVLWQNPTSGNVVLVGVINYGISCAVVGSVNARVGAYMDWITSVTPDANYCVIE